MSVHFKDISNIIVVYFGKLEFLDNQAAFTEAFGYKPTIIYLNITALQDLNQQSGAYINL